MDGSKKKVISKALVCAFPHTIPILAGFLFLGMAYGIYMNVSGFSFVYPMIMSAVIFGGSLEFVTVSMLLSAFAPIQTLLMAFMIQARHLFYGIAMLDRFKNMGWKKFYLIYAMCDETFSVNYSAEIPEDVDRGWFYFWVTLFNQIYWVGGATLGTMATRFLPFMIFNEKRTTPKYITYLGRVLPGAIFSMLIVYCLKNVNVTSYSYGLPELIAIIVTVLLHKWKKQMLVSIAGGTICYMLLVQLVFR